MNKRVMLVNLPGKKIYLRDQYCSQSSKLNYYWGAYDLAIQSGIIAENNHMKMIDAIAEKLTVEQTLSQINLYKPDVIIALGSAASIVEDLSFLETSKQKFNCHQIVIGDIFYAYPNQMLKYNFIDAVCLQYPTTELNSYLAGHRNVSNMAYKNNDKIFIGAKHLLNNIKYPIPRHLEFPLSKQLFPFMREQKCILVPTSFGCPHKCNYCPSCNINYSERDIDNLFLELAYLKSINISNIWFRDFTFTANQKRSRQICKRLIESNMQIKWFCMTRTDCLDDDLIKLMKEAGCYLILFGVETIDQKVLLRTQRDIVSTQTEKIFKSCKNNDIKVLSTIIIGLPGDSLTAVRKTISFLNRTSTNFLSVNIFSPRCNTDYLDNIIDTIDINMIPLITNASNCNKSFCDLSIFELKILRLYAYILFYIRPSHMIGIILEILLPKNIWKYLKSY